MLPELLSNWAVGVMAAITLFRTTQRKTRLLASATFVFSLMGFVLCMYPPFQIPLVYLGIAVVVGFLWDEKRRVPLTKQPNTWISAAWLLGALVVGAVILLPFF